MPILTRVDDVVELPDRLPVIALRDLVFFPYMVLPLLIGRSRSRAALDRAAREERLLVLLAQRSPGIEDPGPDDLYRVGTAVRLLQLSRLQDGTARIVVEGLGRVRVPEPRFGDEVIEGAVEVHVPREAEADPRGGTGTSGARRGREDDRRGAGEEAPVRDAAPRGGADPASRAPELGELAGRARTLYERYVSLNHRLPDELAGTLSGIGDRVRLAHLMAGHLLLPVEEKQALLEETEATTLFEGLVDALEREIELLEVEERIDEEVRGRVAEEPPEEPELLGGDPFRPTRGSPGGEELDEWEELEERIREAELPEHARSRAERELGRLRRLSPVAPESAVIRNYLDWIVSLPWTVRTEDNLDVSHAARILDDDHHGLDEVKDRILDHIAVLSLVGELQGPILCLVGPPGVGKTSLGRSIARALDRRFVRISLGGVRDEAEIRGHRRTYVGALPGRILQGIRKAGSRNPVFLLDEVDKVARDFHGDPAAALLEVLDPEQNRTFADHYLELEFDLSHVLFVTTANTLAEIPGPLRDRMEVIRIPGYLETEKRVIGREYIWTTQLERHGLSRDAVRLADDALDAVIDRYTREAGVRELERRLSRIARKVARKVAEGEREAEAPTVVEADDLRELLGPPSHLEAAKDREARRVGLANALAWTPAGGEVLDVEVAVVPGRGKLQLTGTLGDIMKESATAAVTYARSRAGRLGLDPEFHRSVDLHIHIPEGATPKDGPSAGITIAVALVSALTEAPTRGDVAMTGEITLRGRVLPVGGLKEKAVAALRAGIRTVLIPEANLTELDTLPEEVRNALDFVGVRTMDEVLEAALEGGPEARDASALSWGAPGLYGGGGEAGTSRPS